MNSINEHPTEELLTSVALDEGQEAVVQHVLTCPECSCVVEQIRTLKEAIINLPQEELSPSLRQNILTRKKSKGFSIFHGTIPGSHLWISNPLVLIIGFVIFLTFLYFFIIFVLK